VILLVLLMSVMYQTGFSIGVVDVGYLKTSSFASGDTSGFVEAEIAPAA
jgi:hypothetical protein